MEKNKGNGLPIRNDEEKGEIQGRVICKHCGKDFEFTKTVELHMNCPRCGKPLDRNLRKENKDVKRVINFGIFVKIKKYFLFIAMGLSLVAIAYNCSLFFSLVFANEGWWYALFSLPLVILSGLLARTFQFTSKSVKIRVFSWLVVALNLLALIAIIVTAVPYINERLTELYNGAY